MKRIIRLILNIIMAGVVIVAWLHMYFAGGGVLAHEGFTNLRFYTVLSNLLEAIASVIWVVAFAKASAGTHSGNASKASARRGSGNAAKASASARTETVIPRWVEVLKHVAAVSVFLTFTIVLLFLGPLYGHDKLYLGANLWFHLLIPVFAVVEMMFLSDCRITARDNRMALYPTILYGVVYMFNNIINGIGEWPDTNDWYGFLLWGYPVGILIFIGIGVCTWALGRLIKLVNNRRL